MPRVLFTHWTVVVLAEGSGGLRGRGAVATSCALVAFLHGDADVLSRVVLTVHTVTGVANALFMRVGSFSSPRWTAEACAIAAQ